MKETIQSTAIDESTEITDVLDRAFTDLADEELYDQSLALLLSLTLEYLPRRYDDIPATLLVLDDLELVRLPEQILDEVQRKTAAAKRPIPYHKRVQAELLDDKASLFASLAEQIHQRQRDDPKPVLFLSDGERALRTLQQRYLPEAIPILDLWHVMEYLWKGAHVFHAEGSPQAQVLN